jgi:hypothetical protein
MSATRHDALVEVVDLIRRHGLTVDEVASALEGRPDFKAEKSVGMVSRLLAYLGGIFLFVGLAVFVGMRWDELGPAGRVLLTLGPGFCLFVFALVCTTDARFERAATPLFLVAAVVQPTGILVALQEYGRGGDPAHAALFMSLVMLVQQGCAFWARRRTVLAFTTIVFGAGFVFVALDLLAANRNLIGVTMGISLLCVGWSLSQSVHRPLAGLVYFTGASILLSAAYDWMRRGPIEVAFVGLACGVVVVATVARSRSLLVVGTVALIGYIGDFIYRHFAENLGAPLVLMAIGLVFIAAGAAAVRINTQYIAEKPARSAGN